MLSENLKRFRKKKGFSQQELAIRLNVVRQTISKWEKGLSVPDSDMLIKISEVYEISVNELLGADIKKEQNVNAIAEQLTRINEQLAIRNNRVHRIFKTIAIVIISIFVIIGIIFVLGSACYLEKHESDVTTVEKISYD